AELRGGARLVGHLAVDEIEEVGRHHDGAGEDEPSARQGPCRRDVDADADEGEDVRVDPEGDAEPDDGPQGKHEDRANGAREAHDRVAIMGGSGMCLQPDRAVLPPTGHPSMAIEDLKPRISRLPEQPGVYLYQNREGATVYVGKARALRDRVRSYLGARGTSPRMDAMLDEIADVQVIVTDSVAEALALENNLIKERAPKYNIKLRDDKTYPYLRLTTSEDFPRVEVARRIAQDGDHYAGPFMPASLAWRTRSLTHKLFGVRSCREVITGRRGRPCLEYDIKRCLAPCVAAICTQEQYGHAVRDARLLLDGRTDELIDDLESRMYAAA